MKSKYVVRLLLLAAFMTIASLLAVWWFLRMPLPVVAKAERLGAKLSFRYSDSVSYWAEPLGLRRFQSITFLQVDSDEFHDSDLAEVAQDEFVFVLDVRSNRITDRGVEALSKPPQGAERQVLSDLRLDCPSVTDKGLAALGNIVLTDLKLIVGHNVTGDFASSLAKHGTIQFLTIQGDGIGDSVIEPISRIKRLEYLDLSGTQVSDAELLQLAKLNYLVHVNLQDTAVTRAGVTKLRTVLPEYVVVKSDW